MTITDYHEVAAETAPFDAALPPEALEALDADLRVLCHDHVARALQHLQGLQPHVPVTAQDVVLLQLKVMHEIAQAVERMQGLVCNAGAARGLSNTAMGEPLGIGREGVRGLRQRAERSAQ